MFRMDDVSVSKGMYGKSNRLSMVSYYFIIKKNVPKTWMI